VGDVEIKTDGGGDAYGRYVNASDSEIDETEAKFGGCMITSAC